ncbi:MAG: nucleotidyltransferase family protein [Patescibacteria group bacterium]|nr:nucleotidyltransferase family protein [Patescibacteria group bacterium]
MENIFEPKAEQFYGDSLKILNKSKVPFLVGGTVAVSAYTGIIRLTKDMDIFCKAGDYPKILEAFAKAGYKTEVTDARWLAKVWQDKKYFDLVFNLPSSLTPVSELWFKESQNAKIFGVPVRLLPPTELVFSKAFVQDRHKYEGSDVAHLILIKKKEINWKRLLSHLDQYWEILLIHLLNFRFIYPSERESAPRWLMDELLARLQRQINTPPSRKKICRGRLFSAADYEIDVKEWGFSDIV